MPYDFSYKSSTEVPGITDFLNVWRGWNALLLLKVTRYKSSGKCDLMRQNSMWARVRSIDVEHDVRFCIPIVRLASFASDSRNRR